MSGDEIANFIFEIFGVTRSGIKPSFSNCRPDMQAQSARKNLHS